MVETMYEIDWGSVSSLELVGIGVEENVYPQQQYKVTDEVLKNYFTAATELFHENNYGDARDAFTFLTFLNPSYSEFWIGLGLAEQSFEKYESASVAYQVAEMLDPKDPIIHANLYTCFSELNQLGLAEQSFHKCVEACGDNPEFSDIKASLIQIKENK